MVQGVDKHGGYAVQACTFFVLHGLQCQQGVEGVIGVNRRGAMGQAGQVAHNHTKAVVQRNGDAQAILISKAHAVRAKKAVVQDITMGEGGAFG